MAALRHLCQGRRATWAGLLTIVFGVSASAQAAPEQVAPLPRPTATRLCKPMGEWELTTGNTRADTRMKQDFAVLTAGFEAKRPRCEASNNFIELRLRAVDEKLGL